MEFSFGPGGTRSLVLRDDHQTDRVVLGTENQASSLGVYTTEGKPAVALGGSKAGGRFIVADAAGHATILLACGKRGGGICVFNRAEELAAGMVVTDAGEGAVAGNNAVGKTGGILLGTGSGGFLSLSNREGSQNATLGPSREQGGRLLLYHPDGRPGAALTTGHDDSQMLLSHGEWSPMVKLSATSTGGRLRLDRPPGKLVLPQD